MAGFRFLAAISLFLLVAPNGRTELRDNSARSVELSSAGDRKFREAHFSEAEAAYTQALDLDPNNFRGHLGMGKIASLLSKPQLAAKHYSAAYQIKPHDPDAILALAGIVKNPNDRQTLLRNFLALPKNTEDARAEDVRARLQIEQEGTRTLPATENPHQSYRIPLSGIRTGGVLLASQINGKKLRLILDTGATGITLNPPAGAEVRPEFLVEAALTGFGSAPASAARMGRAASFECSGLRIANLLLNVSDKNLTTEADGFIGIDVFQDFLIRLDFPGRTLELTPFSETPAEIQSNAACRNCMQAYRLGNLFLLRGIVNGAAGGYFILDSGSPYTMVSRKLVPEDGRTGIFHGAGGGQKVALPSSLLGLRIGSWSLAGFDYAAFDADEVSFRIGTEIAGIIGYSALRDFAVTVDYRTGIVKFTKPNRHRSASPERM